MSLHDSIERRRAAEPPVIACIGTAEPSPTLKLSLWNRGEWALPWSHFESAKLVNDERREQLLMSFTKHEVVVTGENLRAIWDDVTAFRVGSLRDLPERYRAKVSLGATFVTRIEVKERENVSNPSNATC